MKTRETAGKAGKRHRAVRARRTTPTIIALDDDTVVEAIDRGFVVDRHARLTGGDVDADWQRAEAVGDEAVGGSTATPDQDVVDEIGRAVGMEIPDEEELHTSEEILRARDRFRWHLERDAEDEAEGRHHHRRGAV